MTAIEDVPKSVRAVRTQIDGVKFLAFRDKAKALDRASWQWLEPGAEILSPLPAVDRNGEHWWVVPDDGCPMTNPRYRFEHANKLVAQARHLRWLEEQAKRSGRSQNDVTTQIIRKNPRVRPDVLERRTRKRAEGHLEHPMRWFEILPFKDRNILEAYATLHQRMYGNAEASGLHGGRPNPGARKRVLGARVRFPTQWLPRHQESYAGMEGTAVKKGKSGAYLASQWTIKLDDGRTALVFPNEVVWLGKMNPPSFRFDHARELVPMAHTMRWLENGGGYDGRSRRRLRRRRPARLACRAVRRRASKSCA